MKDRKKRVRAAYMRFYRSVRALPHVKIGIRSSTNLLKFKFTSRCSFRDCPIRGGSAPQPVLTKFAEVRGGILAAYLGELRDQKLHKEPLG